MLCSVIDRDRVIPILIIPTKNDEHSIPYHRVETIRMIRLLESEFDRYTGIHK